MNLNWLKKLFASDEKEYEEEYKEKQQTLDPTKKKTPFRFPLISDEEKMKLYMDIQRKSK